MKKLCLLMLFFVLSCSSNNEERFLYTFSSDSSLEIIENEGTYMLWGNVISGNNLVFQYEYHAEDDENIADDEYSEYIRFEIDPNLSEFEYKDEGLANIKLVLTQSCFCGFFDEEKEAPPTGTVSGRKISENLWSISIDATFYSDQKRNISGNFTLKN